MSETDTTFETLKAALADRYDVERKLGAGGMAAVYLAKDIKHDRDVAIKVLHPELAATIGADRFEREIRLAAKLQHPHILGLYDSGNADGLLYYVMPFVRGEALRDRLVGRLDLGGADRPAGNTPDAGRTHRASPACGVKPGDRAGFRWRGSDDLPAQAHQRVQGLRQPVTGSWRHT